MPALPGIANDTSPAAARPEMTGQPELPDPVTELAAVQLNAPDDEDGGAAALASEPALTGRAPTGCAPELNAALAEAATVSLEFEAPCAANAITTIHHQGMIFTIVTDAAGRAEVTAPALARNAVFIAELPNGAGAAAIVTVPDLDDFDRAVLQWQGDTGLQIHALEFGAGYDDEGHVWSASARGTDAALAGNGGFLMKLGAEGVDNAFHAEVYTFPTGMVSQSGQVDLSVEAEVRPTTCGREISAQTIQVTQRFTCRFAGPDHDPAGLRVRGRVSGLEKHVGEPDYRGQMTRNILTTTGSWVKGAATIAALLLLASSLRAQDVTLRSVLGDLVVEGTFLGFDGDYIRVETPAGELTLDYGKVECSGAACPDPETHVERLRFAGTSRIGELILPALVEGFARSRNQRVEREEMEGRAVYSVSGRVNEPDVRVEIHLTTTEGGVAAIRARDADVAMAVGAVRSVDDRSVTKQQSGVSGDTRRIRIIAYDAVVPIVSPGSRIRPLSLSDLSHLFAGEIGNWSRLGGPDATPRLHLGNPETGLAQFFVERVLSATGRSLTDRAVRHDSDRDIVDAVMDDPAAIGLVSFERIENAISLPLPGRCGLSDRATLDTVKTGDFPLTVPLYLHLPAHRLGPFGRAFVVWMSVPTRTVFCAGSGSPAPWRLRYRWDFRATGSSPPSSVPVMSSD